MPRVVAYLLACIPYTILVRRFWFNTDDAFISFRYARNLAGGNGLRFNPGEPVPVEGFSNFLWVILCAGVERAGLDVTFWPLVVSAACGYVLLALVLARLTGRLGVATLPAALATLTLGAFPPFALWSTGGLATMPFALLVFVTFDRLVLRETPDAIGGGVAAVALTLIRAEGAAWAAVLLALAVVREPRRLRALLPAAGILAAGLAAYLAWRHAYFGHFLPNTAQAKMGTSFLLDGWLRGFYYVATQFLAFVSPWLLLPATVVALAHHGRTGLVVAALSWAFPVYSVVVTGDFMSMGRFLVPAFAFQTILFAWLLEAVPGGRARRGFQVALALGVVVVAALPAWDVHALPESVREHFNARPGKSRKFRSEYGRWLGQLGTVERNTEESRILMRYLEARPFSNPEPVAVVTALGVFGYHTGLPLLDRVGLVTPSVLASPPLPPLESVPGHDRIVPSTFFLPQRPEVLEFTVLRRTDPVFVHLRCAKEEEEIRDDPHHAELIASYVLDFAYLSSDAGDEVPVLMAWRRIEGDADHAWAAYRARLDSLRLAATEPARKEGRPPRQKPND